MHPLGSISSTTKGKIKAGALGYGCLESAVLQARGSKFGVPAPFKNFDGHSGFTSVEQLWQEGPQSLMQGPRFSQV